ncbi:hypothetical protein XF14_17855 [Burkholderia gladioli]|nr:hypothetical protein XF14_17855 [Burkholderia gladioli]
MGDALVGAQARAARHHRAHQFIGVQTALHDRADAAGGGEFDRPCGRGMAVRHLLERPAARLDAGLRGHPCQPGARRDDHRLEQRTQGRIVDRGERGEADRVTGMRDRDRERRQAPSALDQRRQSALARQQAGQARAAGRLGTSLGTHVSST